MSNDVNRSITYKFETNLTIDFSTSRITHQDNIAPFPNFPSRNKTTDSEEISNLKAPGQSTPASTSSISKKIEVIHRYVLYGTFTRNNTLLTLTAVTEDLNHFKRNPNLSYNDQVLYHAFLPQKVKISLSGGNVGFRKSARGEYEAGFQTAAKMFQLMEQRGYLDKDLEIIVKNFGKGREAFTDALKGKEGNRIRNKIVRLSDNTKLKFGGVRAPRKRRL